MNKVASIWPKIILLAVFLASGWFLFISKKNIEKLTKEKLPNHAHSSHFKQTVKGKVLEYASNPEGDIDKILISSQYENVWLHFPPHAAKMVIKIAPVYASIEADIDQGGPGHHPHPDHKNGVFELKQLRNYSSNAAINLANIPPPAPSEGIETEVKGSIVQDLKYENNNTFSLSGKIISLPPFMARALFPLINQANQIIVKGKMRDTTGGFVTASGEPVIKANTIQLDSVIYKIR